MSSYPSIFFVSLDLLCFLTTFNMKMITLFRFHVQKRPNLKENEVFVKKVKFKREKKEIEMIYI